MSEQGEFPPDEIEDDQPEDEIEDDPDNGTEEAELPDNDYRDTELEGQVDDYPPDQPDETEEERMIREASEDVADLNRVEGLDESDVEDEAYDIGVNPDDLEEEIVDEEEKPLDFEAQDFTDVDVDKATSPRPTGPDMFEMLPKPGTDQEVPAEVFPKPIPLEVTSSLTDLVVNPPAIAVPTPNPISPIAEPLTPAEILTPDIPGTSAAVPAVQTPSRIALPKPRILPPSTRVVIPVPINRIPPPPKPVTIGGSGVTPKMEGESKTSLIVRSVPTPTRTAIPGLAVPQERGDKSTILDVVPRSTAPVKRVIAPPPAVVTPKRVIAPPVSTVPAKRVIAPPPSAISGPKRVLPPKLSSTASTTEYIPFKVRTKPSREPVIGDNVIFIAYKSDMKRPTSVKGVLIDIREGKGIITATFPGKTEAEEVEEWMNTLSLDEPDEKASRPLRVGDDVDFKDRDSYMRGKVVAISGSNVTIRVNYEGELPEKDFTVPLTDVRLYEDESKIAAPAKRVIAPPAKRVIAPPPSAISGPKRVLPPRASIAEIDASLAETSFEEEDNEAKTGTIPVKRSGPRPPPKIPVLPPAISKPTTSNIPIVKRGVMPARIIPLPAVAEPDYTELLSQDVGEHDDVFAFRTKIAEALDKTIVSEHYFLKSHTIIQFSRFYTNKYWYGMIYDDVTEKIMEFVHGESPELDLILGS